MDFSADLLNTPIGMISICLGQGEAVRASAISIAFPNSTMNIELKVSCEGFQGWKQTDFIAALCDLYVKSKPGEAELSPAADAFTQFKHLLLPVTDGNPYLSEGTKQAMATTAALAKKYEADITVLVINEKEKESLTEHDTQLASIRWHLSEGGYQDFKVLERLGEGGKKPTAIIGEVADDMSLDLVVMSMEAIHSKHVDANLLAEFIPCPVLLLPL